MGGGGSVGNGDGVGYTMAAVGVIVGGGKVAVGKAVWVRETYVPTMASAVFCASAGIDLGGVQAARRMARKAMVV